MVNVTDVSEHGRTESVQSAMDLAAQSKSHIESLIR